VYFLLLSLTGLSLLAAPLLWKAIGPTRRQLLTRAL
jgi:hypothetical protein